MRNIILLGFFAICTTLQFCSKNDTVQAVTDPDPSILNLPATPFNYRDAYPAHISNALALNDNTPSLNPITDAGATLGRVLFYDKNLSFNKSINCASCHKQAEGFTDNIQFSRGFDGGFTDRTSMSTLNLRFYRSGKMFWDERAATLEAQVLMPVQNHVEMGMTLTDLVNRLQTLNYYPALFENAFASNQIDTTRISRALAQFLRSMVTYRAKYDRVKQGLETFTTAERSGEQIFLTVTGPNPNGPTCATCHTPPMFMNAAAPPFTLSDPNDLGINNERRFKSGSLRNITTTTNLFHNGSVQNVQSMLNAVPGIPAHTVAPQDRANLLAFLQTLTDSAILTDVRFTTPFR